MWPLRSSARIISRIACMFGSSVARGFSSSRCPTAPSRTGKHRSTAPYARAAACRPLSAGYRLVIDVGVIDDFGNPVSAQVFQRAAQHIEADEGPEITDVSASVDGEPAGIHPHGVVARRRERLLLPREGVVEAKHVGTSGFDGDCAAVDEELEWPGIAAHDHRDGGVEDASRSDA